MIVTKNQAPVVVPPATYTIELNEAEAQTMFRILRSVHVQDALNVANYYGDAAAQGAKLKSTLIRDLWNAGVRE